MISAKILSDSFNSGIRPDSEILVSDWADKNRVLSQTASSEPGRFRISRTPYLKNIDSGEIFQLMLRCLEEISYEVNYEILSGKDFVVPQNRRRLYVVSSLDHDKVFQFPEPLGIKTHVSDIIEKDVMKLTVL